MAKTKPNRRILIIGLVVLSGLKFALVYWGLQTLHISMPSLSNLFTSVLSSENITSLTNASRKNEALPPLISSPSLEKAATAKAHDMLSNQYFAHVSPANTSPWDFMAGAGYTYIFAGENLAINFISAEDAINGWLTSPAHRENMMNTKYTEIGVGIARGNFLGKETTIVVQMFGRPLHASAETVAKISAAQRRASRRLSLRRASPVAVNSTSKSSVKGAAIESTISQLELRQGATWIPHATINDIYGVSTRTIPLGTLFDLVALSIILSTGGVLLYRKVASHPRRKRRH